MADLAFAESKAKEIILEAEANLENIKTEEDSKIQLINRFLIEVLGWPHSSIRAERKHDNGFSDYVLVERDSAALLIEAKKTGLLSIHVAEKDKVRHLKISGSAMKDCMDGIDQAARYTLPNGIPISILTDGIVWIAFKTFVQGESFKEKEAIVFPNFNSILSDFSIFYDLLSRTQVTKRIYNSVFDGIHNKREFLQKELIAPLSDGDIFISSKSELAFDLDKIFSNFFSRLTGDEDEDLLVECFVESRESRIADFSLEKITRSVLGNISPQDQDVDNQLVSLIEASVDIDASSTDAGQTIFIVGPTGAGKSTFLDRFFRRTLPLSVKKRCVLANVNCLDATGSGETVLSWLTEKLISVLESQLYEGGIPKWDDLLGLFHLEYKKRAQGIDAPLYIKDKAAFKEKFSSYLDEKVEQDREGYLKRILADAVKNRKQLPVLILDNTDEFSIEYKQAIFQFSQALRRYCNYCLVIFPVTDKSAWSFSKTDIFGIYRSRSFFLPTPSPREVFRKRIDFLKNKLKSDTQDKKLKSNYFSNKGIHVSIEDLNGFAHVLEGIFVGHEYVSKTIGELTNYNIRRSLALCQRVITSPVIKIEDLIKSYIIGQPVATNFAKFMDALLKGDYEIYKHGDNHEVFPIFQTDNNFRGSPLLSVRILSLLDATYQSGRSVEDKHIGVQSIIGYFTAIGSAEVTVERALSNLLEAGLIESYDISNKALSMDQRVALSHRGIAHLRLASHNTVFFYQMALVTAISNKDVAYQISSMYKSKVGFFQKIDAIKKLFLSYLLDEDSKYFMSEIDSAQYDCQKILIADLKKFSAASQADSSGEDFGAVNEDANNGHDIRKEVSVVIDFFDPVKGFGFAEVEGENTRVYVGQDKLKECGLIHISHGDSLVCDLGSEERGLFVLKVHQINTDDASSDEVECEVIRYFSDRGYGFARVADGARTAYFHISIFSGELRSEISEGRRFIAQISPDKKGDGFCVKRVISFKEIQISC